MDANATPARAGAVQVMGRYLTEPEQRRLFAAVRGTASLLARRDSAWMEALRSTGMRITEWARMTRGDARLALETGYVFIPKDRRKGRRADHSVLVTEPVAAALGTLLEVGEAFGAADEAAPLVLSRKHAAMSVRQYQERVRFWARRAGIAGAVSPHWFRHTRAMNIMRRSTARDPRGIVQATLGHASIASTGVYTRVAREDLERELHAVDGRRRVEKRELRAHYEAMAAAAQVGR